MLKSCVWSTSTGTPEDWTARCNRSAVARSRHSGFSTMQGVPADRLDAWIKAVGWELLVNRQGTTWRKFDDATKAGVVDATSAKALMLANASVIKRPVVELNGKVVCVGFDESKLATLKA